MRLSRMRMSTLQTRHSQPSDPKLSRRSLMTGLTGSLALAAWSPAFAVTKDVAVAYIEETIAELRKILAKAAGRTVDAPELRRTMIARSNMSQIARYCAGRAWRDMSDDQKTRYIDAFSHYISVTYARRFNDFSGTPVITIGRTNDLGRKGMLVESPIAMPNGKVYRVEWLVSDRGGSVQIIDIVIEGISLAATQRDEIGAMLDKRSGKIDALISALKES